MATGIQTSVQRGRRSGIVQRPQQEGKIWNRAVELWKGLGSAKQFAAMGFLAALLVGALFGARHVHNGQYQDLYPLKLNAEDVAEISMLLTNNGVDHTVSPTNDSILLAPENRFKARAMATAHSLPRRNPAPQPEDSSSFTHTADARRLEEQRKLQAEIVYTLRQVEGIKDARVQLAIPKKAYWGDDKNQATASVFLELEGGPELSASKAAGIAALVAHSVPDLKEENVTLLDHRGREITPEVSGDDAQLKIQSEWEKTYQDKLQSALKRIFGDKAYATVNVSLDFSEEERRNYTPGSPADDGMVKDSIQLVHEMLEGGDKKDGKSYDNKKEAINYKFTENYYAMLRKTAKVERITASIMIDGASDKELEAAKGVAMGTLGIDEINRADAVYTNGTPWNHNVNDVWADQPTLPAEPTPASNGQATGAVALGALIGVGGLAASFLVSRSKPVLPMELGGGGVQTANGITDHHQNKNGSPIELDATTSHSGKVAALEQLVEARPDRVATLLRSTWLS